MKLAAYLNKLPRKGKERGQSPSWAEVEKALADGPIKTRELAEKMGWTMDKTRMILYRMRRAGIIEYGIKLKQK